MIHKFPQIYLASQSPRRVELLERMGFSFHVIPAYVDESYDLTNSPEAFVIELSRKKAESVLDKIEDGLIVGADTIVCLERKILGKPKHREDAKRMLESLSGRTHTVFTGFTLLLKGGICLSDVEKTKVTFRHLEDWEIDAYAASDSPLDKAGAYGIQDRSGLFVDKIEGCFYNVVGFPLTKFYQGLIKLLGPDVVREYFKDNRRISE